MPLFTRFMYPRWLFGISEPSTVFSQKNGWFFSLKNNGKITTSQQKSPGFLKVPGMVPTEAQSTHGP